MFQRESWDSLGSTGKKSCLFLTRHEPGKMQACLWFLEAILPPKMAQHQRNLREQSSFLMSGLSPCTKSLPGTTVPLALHVSEPEIPSHVPVHDKTSGFFCVRQHPSSAGHQTWPLRCCQGQSSHGDTDIKVATEGTAGGQSSSWNHLVQKKSSQE